MRVHLAAILCLVPAICAQTFVVDSSNGPGTNFIDLPTAVATVPDGAMLLVRAGSYSGFAMTGKGLTILGDPGVAITGAVSIASTQSHQPVTLRQVTWSSAQLTSGNRLLEVTHCSGSVLLERVVQPPFVACPLGQCAPPFGVYAISCTRLHLRACTVRCTAWLDSSDVTLESCTIQGEDVNSTAGLSGGRTALRLNNTNAQVCGSSLIQGGAGWPSGLHAAPAGQGIFMVSGSLRLLDGQVLAGANGWLPAFTIFTSGAVTLRISPRVTLVGGLGPQSGSDIMPALTGASAPPGGTLTATTVTENGDLVVLAVGLPGPPIVIAGMQDPFWLDPVVHVFQAIGVQQVGVPVAGGIPVPAGPAFLGLRLNWQAACYGPVTGLQASNPVAVVVH